MDSTATVQEVMDRAVVGVSESDTVRDTAELMLSEGRESVVVLRGSEPVGLLGQRDALAALVEESGDDPVADAMTTTVPTVRPETTVGEAASEMSSRATQRLLVTNGDEPLGVVSEHDLVTTAPFTVDPGAAPDPEGAVAGGAGVDAAGPAMETTDDGFADQSICEACGSFASDLAAFNGQLLCADCRDM